MKIMKSEKKARWAFKKIDHSSPEIVDMLREKIYDPNPEMQEMALWALGESKPNDSDMLLEIEKEFANASFTLLELANQTVRRIRNYHHM